MKLSRQILIQIIDKFFLPFFSLSLSNANSMSKNNYHPYELLIGRLRFCVALYTGFVSYFINSSS